MKFKFRKRKSNSLWVGRFRYLLLWCIVGVCFVFYQSYSTCLCFVSVTLLPFISYGTMRGLWKRVSLTLSFDQREYVVHTTGFLRLEYKGKQLPFALCCVSLCIDHVFYHSHEEQQVSFFTAPQTMVQYPMQHTSCGKIEARIQAITCYDLLGLWKYTYPIKLSAIAYVLPKSFHSTQIDTIVNEGSEAEKLTQKKGDLAYSDAYEIREYREGDTIKHLHHKLTFKLDKLMVKEFAKMEEASCYLLVDLSGEQEVIEQTLALCYSVALAFVKQQQTVSCCWLCDEQVQTKEVKTTSMLHDVLQEMVSNPHPETSISYLRGNDMQIYVKGYEIRTAHAEEVPYER